MNDENDQEELAMALPEEADEEAVNHQDIEAAAPDEWKALSDEEVLIAEETEFSEEMELPDEPDAAGSPKPAVQALEAVNGHNSEMAGPDEGETQSGEAQSDEDVLTAEETEFSEEMELPDEPDAAGSPEPAVQALEAVNGYNLEMAEPDEGETQSGEAQSDEDVLTAEETEFPEEMELLDEPDAAGSPEPAVQALEAVNGYNLEMAGPDEGETQSGEAQSDEDVLTAEETGFAEEMELPDEAVAAGSPESAAQAEELVNDHVVEMAAPDQGETLTDEEALIAEETESTEEIESPDEAAAAGSPESADQAEDQITATREEIKPAIEALLFVAEEPLPFKALCKILGDVSEEDVRAALDELAADYEARNSGLEIREIAGGWRISTRPQNHDFIRKYLKSRPSARLSLPALETLAVIAYKQPITIPEILEIRGVTSSSAIKTLLEKRLIVTKGRKETVGRPMLYGTSKEFLIQFGLKDLSELPSIEDFEDLAQ
jgi:segregation and condensation protein B